MQIQPILAALRHHKAGTVLIALQIALTLAIVCNALFIIHQRVAHLSEPTGIDEANLFVIDNGWADRLSNSRSMHKCRQTSPPSGSCPASATRRPPIRIRCGAAGGTTSSP